MDQFHRYLLRQLPELRADELAEFTAAFALRRVRKREFIVQPGQVAAHLTYVVQGAFQAYVIDPAGTSHTIQFAIEDWWITDVNSYLYRQPATMHVVALEDSTVLQLDFATEQRLKQANPRFNTLFRLHAERATAYHQRRLISALTRTAEERYAEFVATYPVVIQRLPQYVIASGHGHGGRHVCGRGSGCANEIAAPQPTNPAPATASIYPNPARDNLYVNLENADTARPTTVRLFDNQGQLRLEQNSTQEATIKVKINKLRAGIYFVHVLRGSDVITRQQL